MKRFARHIMVAILATFLASCIKNDIPYPRIQANFITLEAEGQTRGSLIDTVNLTATLYLPEEVDIANVDISEYTVTPGAEVLDDALDNPIDLTRPFAVTLRYYQDYQWLIKGSQEIERYFTCSDQVGSATIDAPGRRVICNVSKRCDISKITVESIKLGPVGSTMTPDLEGKTVDFSEAVEVQVTAYGRTSLWTIYIEKTETNVSTTSIDAWTNVAWVYGEGLSDRENGVEYRIKGDAQWTRAPKDWITTDGGSFHARLIHLSPLTPYEARAYSGDEYGETLDFTTGAALQVPNSDFDSWWLDGKVWCPWPEGGEQVWDTGNKGATTLGASNSVPTDETVSGTGWAAKLETKFIGIGIIGKLGAGNIFVGKYVRTDGTNGVLDFGYEFHERPTKLRGYLNYKDAPISSASGSFADWKGRPDTCIVWCALIDTPERFQVRTNPNDRQLFDPDASYVVAYGRVQYGESIPDYIPFEFNLEYRSTSRRPTYIIIAASASKYGDYFVGGNGAVMCVDDIELLYDY